MATVGKRKHNSGRQAPGPEAESPFVNIPWGRTQDEDFDNWAALAGNADLVGLVNRLVADGLTVKIGAQGDSRFATLDSRDAATAGTKHLLSGWSDSIQEAVQIAVFKWESLLERNWDHPTAGVAKSRRR